MGNEIREKDYDFTVHDQTPKEGYYKGKYLPIWPGQKFNATRDVARALLKSKEFSKVLTKDDFWILTNLHKHYAKGGIEEKLIYSGIIITHDALVKVNDTLNEDTRFDQKYCSEPIPFEYGGNKGLLMTYRDERDGMFEIGEISSENCQSGYPYAMLLKRTFDRVVRRKAKILGIYSDTEAANMEDDAPIDPETGEIAENPAIATTTVAPKESKKTTGKGGKTGNPSVPTEPKKTVKAEKPEEPEEGAEAERVQIIPTENEPKEGEVMLLEEALAYTFEEGLCKGIPMKKVLSSPHKTDTKKMIVLNYYATGTTKTVTKNDILAARAVKAEIEAGHELRTNSLGEEGKN